MDAPAMLTRKHVPEDIGHRNTGEGELPPTPPATEPISALYYILPLLWL